MLLGMPLVPIVVVREANWTVAERHLFFCVSVFMAYWGAGMVETIKIIN